MAELLTFSKSSVLLSPNFRLSALRQGRHSFAGSQVSLSAASPLLFFSVRSFMFPTISTGAKHFSWGARATVVSDARMPTTFTVDSAGEGIDILPDSGGSNGDSGGPSNNSGGRGGNGGNDDNEGKGGSNENEDQSRDKKKMKALSMSQTLTLGYAALVGFGGVMGYLRSGSQKSLLAGGISASLLYYVYATLPTKPVLASSIGLGLSASLLGVMGSRFKKSGKIFPAGIVSLASLVMSGGYLHGILRTMH